jgi:hypothetical protein
LKSAGKQQVHPWAALGMLGAMEGSIDIKGGGSLGRIPWTDRVRVGGEGCEVLAKDAEGDELHLWADPARLVLAGSRTTPLVNGRAVVECELEDGDTIQWQGMLIVVHPPEAEQVHEIPAKEGAQVGAAKRLGDTPKAPAPARTPDPSLRQLELQDLPAARRILAGIAAEMGSGDRAAIKRWQAAVLRGEWDADACARDVLAGVDLESKALCERSGRIQRDLLMASFQRGVRGASRKVRGAARGGSAFLVANLVAVLVYSLLIGTLLVLGRARWQWSLDGTIDDVLKYLSGLFGGAG